MQLPLRVAPARLVHPRRDVLVVPHRNGRHALAALDEAGSVSVYVIIQVAYDEDGRKYDRIHVFSSLARAYAFLASNHGASSPCKVEVDA